MTDKFRITISKNNIAAFISMLLLTLYCYTYGGLKRYIFVSLIVSIVAFVTVYAGMLYLSRGIINIKNVYLIALILICAIIIVFNRNANFLNNNYENDIAILFILLFLIIAVGNSKWHKFFIGFSFVAAVIHTSVTLLEYILPGFYKSLILPLFRGTMYYSDLVRLFNNRIMPGLAGHFSTNGLYLSVGLLIASIYLLTKKKKSPKMILFIVFIAIALLLTGKRGVLIFSACGVFFAYYCLNSDKPLKRIVKIIALVIVIAVSFLVLSQFIPQINNFINRFIETSNRGDITTGRVDIYNAALKLFKDKSFFGIGWDAFKYSYSDAYGNMLNVHNVFLQLLVENGVFGALPFYALFCFLYYRAVKNFVRYVKNTGERSSDIELAFALSVGIQTMFLLYCFTGNPLYDPPILFPYICCCAMGEYYILNMRKV